MSASSRIYPSTAQQGTIIQYKWPWDVTSSAEVLGTEGKTTERKHKCFKKAGIGEW
jgi:hypothetical protein